MGFCVWIYALAFSVTEIELLSGFVVTCRTQLLPFCAFFCRAKDMKNRLAFLRRRNESPGSTPAGKLDKTLKSVK